MSAPCPSCGGSRQCEHGGMCLLCWGRSVAEDALLFTAGAARWPVPYPGHALRPEDDPYTQSQDDTAHWDRTQGMVVLDGAPTVVARTR